MIALLRLRKRINLLLPILALVCLLAANAVATYAQQDAPMQSPIPQPNPPRPVVDTANVIDDATEQRLNERLIELDKQARIEFGVVTVRTTGGQDIFDYSLAVMRGWGIGNSEKPGLLLLLAIDDRKYFTQVSRHLEGDLPDGVVGQIQREHLVPQLKQGNYSQAINDTVEAYIATMAEKRGFTITNVDKRKASPPRRQREQVPQFNMSSGCCIGIIILVIIIFLISSRGRGGGGGSGCLNLLFLGSMLSNLSRGSSGWGGGAFGGSGGSSGWGGGGGGDWGGFSGGGGDAGGGGAGGSW